MSFSSFCMSSLVMCCENSFYYCLSFISLAALEQYTIYGFLYVAPCSR